jgi:hypothetical protein
MMLAVASLVLALATAGVGADVKGKWEGKLFGERPDGTVNEDTALLILDQKDNTITGSIGGGEDDQHKISSGSIEGNKVTIVARTENGREFKLELTVDGETMKGTIAQGERRGKVEVKRQKK